jgi:hypothetical protein
MGKQYQHGVKKNIFEAVGGVLVGAASVLFIATLFRKSKKATSAPAAIPATDTETNS